MCRLRLSHVLQIWYILKISFVDIGLSRASKKQNIGSPFLEVLGWVDITTETKATNGVAIKLQ